MKVSAKTTPKEIIVDIDAYDLLELLYDNDISSYELLDTLRRKIIKEWTDKKNGLIRRMHISKKVCGNGMKNAAEAIHFG